jgi:hypothetical protein
LYSQRETEVEGGEGTEVWSSQRSNEVNGDERRREIVGEAEKTGHAENAGEQRSAWISVSEADRP